MPTLEEVEVEMDEEELFLHQVWEKLCSPDCSSLVSKLFNMLSNAKQVESAILGQSEDATINATVLPQAHVDVMDKGNLETDMEEGNFSSIDMSLKKVFPIHVSDCEGNECRRTQKIACYGNQTG